VLFRERSLRTTKVTTSTKEGGPETFVPFGSFLVNIDMMKPFLRAPWRDTLITNLVTAGVAVGLAQNFRAGPRLALAPWPHGVPAPVVAIIVPLRDEAAKVARRDPKTTRLKSTQNQ
jgi:hypothetical protein